MSLAALIVLVMPARAFAQDGASAPGSASRGADVSGPVQLRSTPPAPQAHAPSRGSWPEAPAAAYAPGEFERFVEQAAGSGVRRLGSELVTESQAELAPDVIGRVPADYIVSAGDEVLLQVWGSAEADLRLVVDRNGRLSIPRVGAVAVGGTRYADLRGVLERALARVFKNFELSVSLGQLRGMRVFVTGFVARPGSYTVSALSTVVTALLRAGGPTSAGTFRQIDLMRDGKTAARLDLYDLLLRGDRSADQVLQPGDVVHVGPVGPQVAVIGSVNRPAVVELLPNDNAATVLAMAGGFSAVADRSRLAIERLNDRMTTRVVELSLPRDASTSLGQGDLLRAFSITATLLSTQAQNKRVQVEGEVARPGEYVLPASSSLTDAIAAAGGLTPSAFVFGTQFFRESVRATQQENYDRALRDLETDFARSNASQRISSGEQNTAAQGQAAATARLVERLRTLRPSGRIVMQIQPQDRNLPSIALEDRDRIYIPPKPTTVGVFGSVFNTGSYLYRDGMNLGEYLRLAGGPTRGADQDSIFVVRANGQVLSARQSSSGWFGGGARLEGADAQAGDTVFVPEEMDKTTFVQAAKDWTQILYQFGIGLAGIKSAVQ